MAGNELEEVELAEQAVAASDPHRAAAYLSRAIGDAHSSMDPRKVAFACTHIGDLFQNQFLNKVAARPWYRRAIRLLETAEPCVEQGWVAIAPMGCDVDDPEVLLERASFALGRARAFFNVELEVKALADAGLARVQIGDIAEGMTMLDESMALICGGAIQDGDVIAKSVCSFYTACGYAADLARVELWTQTLVQCGIVGDTAGRALYLRHHCDSVRASLLARIGQWGEAESILLNTDAAMQAAMPGAAWHTPIALADLRILQGRLAEAEVLLLGKDDQIQALLPNARLHLARCDYSLASATARRGLRLIGRDRLRAIALLGVLIEAELGRGDRDSAEAAVEELRTRLSLAGTPGSRAEAARLQGKVLAAQGRLETAVELMRATLAELGDETCLLARLALHLELANSLEQSDPETAAIDARAAFALLARLDVVLAPAEQSLLSRFGLPAAHGTSPRRQVASLSLAGGFWTVDSDGVKVRLQDTKGLRYIATLIAHPGVEWHSLDLVDAIEGLSAEGVDRRKLGDAGPMSDRTARDSFRRRIVKLRDEVEAALAIEDDEAAQRTQQEIDDLVHELARSFGLDGRDRRASSVAEKARLNVTRAIRSAVSRLIEQLPLAGWALDRQLATGAYCRYQPLAHDEILWVVQPSMNN